MRILTVIVKKKNKYAVPELTAPIDWGDCSYISGMLSIRTGYPGMLFEGLIFVCSKLTRLGLIIILRFFVSVTEFR